MEEPARRGGGGKNLPKKKKKKKPVQGVPPPPPLNKLEELTIILHSLHSCCILLELVYLRRWCQVEQPPLVWAGWAEHLVAGWVGPEQPGEPREIKMLFNYNFN